MSAADPPDPRPLLVPEGPPEEAVTDDLAPPAGGRGARDPQPGARARGRALVARRAGLPGPQRARRRRRLRRRSHRPGRRGDPERLRAPRPAPAGSPRRPTSRSTRSRAPRSSASATTTSCSTESAIRLMVEEAYRSNAAICGPKLVDFDQPEVLLEVGRAIDRFGGAAHGHRAGRARPGAARRGARRVLRRRARRCWSAPTCSSRSTASTPRLPGLGGPRPLLAGPPRRARGCMVVPDASVQHHESRRAPRRRRPLRRSATRPAAAIRTRLHLLLVPSRCSGSCRSASCRRRSRRSSFMFTPAADRGVRRGPGLVVEPPAPRPGAQGPQARAVAAHGPRLRAPRAPARLVGPGAVVPHPPPRRRAGGVDRRPAARP